MSRATIMVVALGAALSLGSTCTPPPPPTPPPGEHPATCQGVCDRWADLGCEQAKGTDAGTSCVDVCQNIMDSGVFEWDLQCKLRVTECSAIDACER